VNECETKQHDCDPRAMCRDEAVGYSCHCPFGFADISPNSTRPGRVCIQREFHQNSVYGSMNFHRKSRDCGGRPGIVAWTNQPQ
ncbi:hypothetical protein ANCDUO_17417, partial [Ancylostoma duodenale]